MKVILDEDAGRFIVTRSSRWREANPDVLDFSQVTGCDTEIRESRTELHWKDSDGEEHDYDPPRYDVDYDMYLTIHVNVPYYDSITFKVNGSRIEERNSVEYREAERQANEIRAALTELRETTREAASCRFGSQGCTHVPLLRSHHHAGCFWALRILWRRHGCISCKGRNPRKEVEQ